MKIIVAHTIKAPLHRPNQNQRSSSVQRARGSRPEPESRTSNLPKLLGPVQAQFLAVASPRGNWPGASHGPARLNSPGPPLPTPPMTKPPARRVAWRGAAHMRIPACPSLPLRHGGGA